MVKVELIGHLGADAEVKDVNGSKFIACRVADSSKWKDKDGTVHESTRWIDVTLHAESPLLTYLKKGTMIYCRGTLTTRVYSSEKDRCQKCGMTIGAQEVQLLSASKKEEEQSTTLNPQQYNGF